MYFANYHHGGQARKIGGTVANRRDLHVSFVNPDLEQRER